MDKVIDFINVNRERYLDELKALLAIPSISALPEHAADVKRCAEWCAGEMRRLGLQNVQLLDTAGNPVVYGDWLGAPGRPTILFYGHYDVQPVDPLDLWESPPFEATVRDGEIFARGAADDKGQVFMHLKAVEAHLKQNGSLPVNIKFMVEGEEEVGSEHLDDFVRAHKADLKADVVVISALCARGAVDLLWTPRAGLLPARPARQQHRSALRIVRRGRGEPRIRAGADNRPDEGPQRPHQDSGFLR
jgi:acetylornithine deacetylase/succinyl-diaminopimelate desuccinylase-like protein